MSEVPLQSPGEGPLLVQGLLKIEDTRRHRPSVLPLWMETHALIEAFSAR